MDTNNDRNVFKRVEYSLKMFEALFEKLSGSEALYGFCGWLTTRKDETVMSEKHDCAIIADLIREFSDTNELDEPRDDWADELTHPIDKKL